MNIVAKINVYMYITYNINTKISENSCIFIHICSLHDKKVVIKCTQFLTERTENEKSDLYKKEEII